MLRNLVKGMHLPIVGEMPPLSGATAWLNSPPLTPAELRGKVVLVDFWTYTCINWLRTLPYIYGSLVEGPLGDDLFVEDREFGIQAEHAELFIRQSPHRRHAILIE